MSSKRTKNSIIFSTPTTLTSTGVSSDVKIFNKTQSEIINYIQTGSPSVSVSNIVNSSYSIKSNTLVIISSSAPMIQYSSNRGTSFSTSTHGFTTVYDVVCNENDLWVACGSDANACGMIQTSTTAAAFSGTVVISPGELYFVDFYNGAFYTVGAEGTIYYSYDTSGWWPLVNTRQTSPLACYHMAFGPTAIVYAYDSGYLYYSTNNGITPNLIVTDTGEGIHAVAYGAQRFVAAGKGNGTGDTKIYYSDTTDITLWSTSTLVGTTVQINDITWADSIGMFLAVGNSGIAYKSLNGINWTTINSGTSYDIRSISWMGTSFFCGIGAAQNSVLINFSTYTKSITSGDTLITDETIQGTSVKIDVNSATMASTNIVNIGNPSSIITANGNFFARGVTLGGVASVIDSPRVIMNTNSLKFRNSDFDTYTVLYRGSSNFFSGSPPSLVNYVFAEIGDKNDPDNVFGNHQSNGWGQTINVTGYYLVDIHVILTPGSPTPSYFSILIMERTSAGSENRRPIQYYKVNHQSGTRRYQVTGFAFFQATYIISPYLESDGSTVCIIQGADSPSVEASRMTIIKLPIKYS